ncbi:MAG TPA: trigger factor [Steroidobacteraceae bacterium]|nr:trigger factor [Steroidobacteraceae bacterium]
MQVSLVSTNGLERRLEVTVPGELVTNRVDERLKDLARTARLKGFRPGKVPFAVVRKQFGGQVHSEAVTDLMQKSFIEAVTQERLRPAGDPRIEPLQVAPGEELRYAAVFEVLPEISLKPLDTLSVNRPTATVTEADIEAMIESMRKQKPIFTPVDRAAAATDRVTIAFEGRIDGEVFPGGKGEELHVVLGAGTILQELDTALHGMKVGEEKLVPAHFPDNYGATAVAGKDAVFELNVKNIEEQSLPALDEAFVRGFGLAEGGVPEFRAQVRATMEQEVADTSQQRVREQLLELVHKANPLELPRVLVDEQVRDLQVQVLRRMGVQKIEQMPPREPYEEPARKRVALGLIIGEIVRANGIKVDRSRVERRLHAAAASHPDPEAVRRQYLQSREAMGQLETAALEDQALDWVLSQVKVVDVASSFAELTGFGRPKEVNS